MCGRIRIIVKKKRRIAIHHPTAVGVGDLLFLLCFLLLSLPNNVWRLIVFAPFIIIIIITSPRLLSGDVLLFYVSVSMATAAILKKSTLKSTTSHGI
jgi:hypothetical protein